jgi:aminoglycoside 6'-N-acetyltransferase I
MRVALYTEADPETDPGELDAEIGMILAGEEWAAFAAADPAGALIGFVEVFERNYAEGCVTSPVPFIEGLWVTPAWRRQGLARQLVAAAVAWGRSRGRSEIASDVQLWNVGSQAMHEALGFGEAERTVAYRMDIPQDS